MNTGKHIYTHILKHVQGFWFFRSNHIMKRLLVIGILIFAFILGAFLWWQNGLQAVNPADKTAITFVVPKGAGLRVIANSLKDQGLIRDPIVFFLEVKKLRLDGTIQAGDFKLSPSMTAEDIIRTMTHGTEDVWVTIPEGKRAEEVAEILQSSLPSYSPDWVAVLKAHEGYLFPDTYLFPKDAAIDQVISIMTDNFTKKYALAKAQETVPFSQSDAVILASILQREGRSGDDMKKVASVLENRLNIGMALQVDASIQYALGYQAIGKTWWKKDLTADDLQIQSPYNTYTNTGLPPTPIANPGLAALEAVLNPARTNYLYYISDNDGALHFASTLDEQNANIRRYGL